MIRLKHWNLNFKYFGIIVIYDLYLIHLGFGIYRGKKCIEIEFNILGLEIFFRFGKSELD